MLVDNSYLLDRISIRKVDHADLQILAWISKQTYFETFFEAFNDPQGFNAYTAGVFADSRLNAELSNLESEFYFVRYQNEVIGYIKLNFNSAQTIFQGEDCVEIERIYVLAAYQNKYAGRELLNHAINLTRNKNLNFLWLSVWESNAKAINFYKRHGFFSFNIHQYLIGGDKQTDLLMKLVLE